VLESGDLLTSRTLRKVTIKRGSEISGGDRKPVTLTITLEKMEHNPDSHTLRLTGPITAGPVDLVQLGSYHTLAIAIRDSISIQKQQWKRHQLDRLDRAKVKKPLLLICVLDREDAVFAMLKESGIEHLAEISSSKAKDAKGEHIDSQPDYHSEILSYLQGKAVSTIVLAGPGFAAENLLNHIKQKDADLAKKVILDRTHSTGRSGITELVKTSANRILKQTRIAGEAEIVERFLSEVHKDGLATYGHKEVRDAVRLGAVQTLLISEEKVRDYEPLMFDTEKQAGTVSIISDDHEAGERFLSLGGIGAILRYKV